MTPLWLALALPPALASSVEAQPTETTPSTDPETAPAERELPDPRRRTRPADTDLEFRGLSPLAEGRFVRNNRLAAAGFGLTVGGGAVGFIGVITLIGGMWGGSGEVIALGTGITAVGAGAVVVGPTLGYVGTLTAAGELREAGIHSPMIWAHGGLAAAGLSLFILPAPVTLPIALLAPLAQSMANRTAFMQAMGRPPGPRHIQQVQLIPFRTEQGTSGLALTGRW